MKNEIKEKHHKEYVHLQCCTYNLYDVLLKIEFIDLLDIMKKYPMNRGLRLIQKINFFFHEFPFFIYVMDDEIIKYAYETICVTYDDLKKLEANEEMLSDYLKILEKLDFLLKQLDK